MTQVLATVFIPAYNAGPYLQEAVESVLAQTLPDWELLIVDDGSTDGSLDAIATLTDDPRVRIHRLPYNQGTGVARNWGLQLARGHFLLNLDADDRATPGRVQHQTEFLLAHPQVDVLTSGLRMFGAVEAEHRPSDDHAHIVAQFLACANNVANPASAMRLSFVRQHQLQFDPDLRVAQDLDFWVSCMMVGARFASSAEIVTEYRMHERQAVRQGNAMALGQRAVLRRLIAHWFDGLSEAELDASAALMLPLGGIPISSQQVQLGLACLQQLELQPHTRANDPDMARVHHIIGHQRQRWQTALERARPT